VVFTAYDNQAGVGDLFLHEVETDVRTRLTFADTDESDPLWSPDGKTIYYRHDDGDVASILALEPEGRDAPRVIYRSADITQLSDVSPDGRYLSFAAADSNSASSHSFVIEIANPTELIRIDEGASASMVPRFSPDGRWISYAQREPGGWTLYVKTFPITTRKWQLTDRDAFWYTWDPAGGRIYHQWAGSELYETEVDLTGSTPRVGQTTVLLRDFEAPLTSLHSVSMTPDRSRFLVSDAGGGEDGRPARLVFGWPKILDGN